MNIPVNYEIIKKGKIAFDANLEYKESYLKNFFSELKDFLFDKFLNSVNNYRSLIKYSEKIYDYYTMVINYYRSSVKAYNLKKDEIITDDVKQIAGGICDVLECQINRFDEANERLESTSNPISKEKEKIIDTNMRLLSRDINLIFEKMKNSFDFSNIENYFDDIYKMYFITVKNCFIQLNDIDSRKIASFYYESLKQEREALTAIIKVQADVLERSSESMDEEVIVQSILMNLREAYQHLCKQIDDTEKGFKESVVYEDVIDKFDDDFKNNILDCLKKVNKKTEKNEKHFKYCNKAFIEQLKIFSKEVYDFEKTETVIEEMNFFTEKVISKFQFLYDYWKINSKNYISTEFEDIISGIAETVNIKIQNIQESADEFNQKTKDIIFQIPNSEKCENLFILCGNYLDENNEANENIINEFNVLFNKYEKINNSIKKLIFKLKKDSILFEVSTFEEIMTYSVSRLRNSQNIYVEEFVQNIDFIFDELHQVLSVVGVEIIAPKPHDLFNGKEHEVIMAEKNVEFKKGEIIKVLNSGYKEDNYVILRANVIAAK